MDAKRTFSIINEINNFFIWCDAKSKKQYHTGILTDRKYTVSRFSTFVIPSVEPSTNFTTILFLFICDLKATTQYGIFETQSLLKNICSCAIKIYNKSNLQSAAKKCTALKCRLNVILIPIKCNFFSPYLKKHFTKAVLSMACRGGDPNFCNFSHFMAEKPAISTNIYHIGEVKIRHQ